jgi:hypothetical protein
MDDTLKLLFNFFKKIEVNLYDLGLSNGFLNGDTKNIGDKRKSS